MKLNVMHLLREQATNRVNQHFNALASAMIHREQAYAVKRELANSVMSSDISSAPMLVEEAALRGVTLDQLATMILEKPNTVEQRELDRQRMLIQIDRAITPSELNEVLAQLPPSPYTT